MGEAGNGTEWRGKESQGKVFHYLIYRLVVKGEDWKGVEWIGGERQGMDGHGEASRCKALQGNARFLS